MLLGSYQGGCAEAVTVSHAGLVVNNSLGPQGCLCNLSQQTRLCSLANMGAWLFLSGPLNEEEDAIV